MGGKNKVPENEVIVVMVPIPAQGHLNQLLHLSRLISSYNIPVHYVGSSTHIRQAKLRVNGWDPLSVPNIVHFHEFPIPSFHSPPPNPNATLKFPSHLQPSFEAASLLREMVAELLAVLSPTAKRVVIIHDCLMGSVIRDVDSIPNGEAYSFHGICNFCSLFLCMGNRGTIVITDEIPLPETIATPEIMEFSMRQMEYQKHSSGVLHNTCRAIEAPFLDVLAEVNAEQWAIGPFNPVEVCENESADSRHKCLEWLDNQPPNSVIYVSFGTTTSLSDQQIHALAVSLESSGQKFIWVLRDADKGDIFVGDVRVCELPEGYKERVELKGQGMILRDWAPQLEILAHASTGRFMSHCGWNSFLESITMGVPIATWPMHSDHPYTALLVNKALITYSPKILRSRVSGV